MSGPLRDELLDPTANHGFTKEDLALIDAFEAAGKSVRAAVASVPASQLDVPCAPGKWSIRQVVVHLLDSDLAAIHRMRRIAAEHLPLLIAYNEDLFIERLHYPSADLEETLHLLEAGRAFTARWLRTMEAAVLDRAGVHNERGKVTLREILQMYVRHVEHHLKYVEGKRKTLAGQ